jgi:ABC-type branched-subunit amino acid transport system permease subunit
VFEMIIAMLGIALAALYVGFLAFKIHSVPLWVIVVATFVLVIREFIVDYWPTRTAEPQGKPDARETDRKSEGRR